MRIILHSVAFVLLLAQGAFGQTEDWTMAKSEDGITVYTRPVDGSSIDEFRAETIIQGSIKDMERVLKDADNMVKWSPDSEESKLLSLEGNEQIYYLETDAPFPVQNRDVCVLLTYHELPGKLRVEIGVIPDYLPKKDGVVRIEHLTGEWIIEEVAANRIQVQYRVHALPGWGYSRMVG